MWKTLHDRRGHETKGHKLTFDLVVFDLYFRFSVVGSETSLHGWSQKCV